MSSVEPISVNTVSGSTREINDQAVDIWKALLSLRWYSLKKAYVVKLPAGGELNLHLLRWRWRSLPPGWKIRLHKQLTTCTECRKRVNQIDREFTGPPEVAELAGWLNDTIQTHVASHIQSSSRHSADDLLPATPIKISMPEDKSGARIKVRSAKEEAVEVVRVAPAPRARIKVSEAPVARPGSAPERSPAPGARRSEEAARVVPAIDYQLGVGTTVEVVIPRKVCTSLIHHCRASLEHGKEVGGVIIGKKEEQHGLSGSIDGYRVRATDLIPFRVADSSGSRLRLTPDSWTHVSEVESDAGYEAQGKVRLGWYHTHPNQGVFFSDLDCDFHTVFSKPFQVALVVDPRNMEAGLFYWKDYARRLLVGPTTFFLSQDREARSPLAVVRDDGKAAPPRGRLAPRRVLFFAGLTLAAVVLLSGGTLYFLTPIDTILLTLIASLALGLWNVQWFHPTHPSELIFLTRIEQWINYAKNSGDKRAPAVGRRRPAIGLLIASVLILLIIGTVVWRSQKSNVSKPPHEVSGQQETDSPAATSGARVDGETKEIVFRGDSANEITLESSDGALAISYQRVGGTWTCDKQDEQEFFQQLFRWDLTEGVTQPYIRDIQIKLASSNPQQSDGKWGQNTRGVLLGKLKTLAKTNGTLNLMLPENRSVTVRIINQSEDGLSEARPDTSTPTKKTTTPKTTTTAKPTAPGETATPKPIVTPPATPKPAPGAPQPENKQTSEPSSPQRTNQPTDKRPLEQAAFGSAR